jgi:hypothetical protein
LDPLGGTVAAVAINGAGLGRLSRSGGASSFVPKNVPYGMAISPTPMLTTTTHISKSVTSRDETRRWPSFICTTQAVPTIAANSPNTGATTTGKLAAGPSAPPVFDYEGDDQHRDDLRGRFVERRVRPSSSGDTATANSAKTIPMFADTAARRFHSRFFLSRSQPLASVRGPGGAPGCGFT